MIDSDALDQMKKRGGSWFAYQNQDLSSSTRGHIRFLKAGPGCTHEVAPDRHPDTSECLGWRYGLVGKVDLEKGEIIK